ncbi:hypothetical protein [Robertmurraya massiliosenegalensis]|uniref:hypothetical protein n=1 Tax=Robertmurraya massiliosenegalensis TaxID=1287657 RepID=UPI0002E664F1|nr:hypothetical protein [Robertmurraya massiliosenegalensis]
MRSFSRHNLIQSELQSLSLKNPNNWFERLFYKLYKNTDVDYILSVPTSTYLRAEAFCEDVRELSEIYFDQSDLLSLLYDGFLHDVRQMDDVQKTYSFLMMTYDMYSQKVPVKILANSDERFHSYFMAAEENNLASVQLEVSFTRKKALRGEILLADMDESFPEHPFTLEKILEMLLYDFIEEYKKGNHKMAMRKIIDNLSDK